MATTAARELIDVVLAIRGGEKYLLRSDPRVRLVVLDYDGADDMLRSGAIEDDGTEWEGHGALDHDPEGRPHFQTCPPITCTACGDWIGDDEPRVAMGAAAEAATYCLPCATRRRPTVAGRSQP
jgi:hypothetical protein